MTAEMPSADVAPGAVAPPAREAASPGNAARGSSSAGRWRYGFCLGVVAVAYLAIYGWLMASTDLLPYVYDNTETFSALWHAANLYHFGLYPGWGLTDEALSPHAAAHPFVHSHQGNFPRIFAFLIYVLGARTAESQILVTTFTIGVVAIFLAFAFLARRAGPVFALTACLVFMTDYLFFAQWHVVTYRVWHVFFVFSSLLCVDGIGGRRRRLWIGLTFLNFLALFYFELIFVAFVATFAGLYAGWRYRQRLATALRFWIVQAVGGFLALAVLMIQGSLFLGPAVFAEDLYLTYFARNLAANDPRMLDRLDTFYRSHPIVFWFNIVDVGGLRSVSAFVGQVYRWHFEALTPFLALLLTIVVAGWLLGAIPWRLPGVRAGRGADERTWLVRGRWLSPVGSARLALRVETPLRLPGWLTEARIPVIRAGAVVALIGAPAVLLAVTLIRDQALLGLPISPASFLRQTRGLGYLLPVLGAAVGLATVLLMLPGWRALARLTMGRALLAAGLLLAIGALVRGQSALYNQEAAPLWLGYLALPLPRWAQVLAVAAASGVAVGLVLAGNRRLLGTGAGAHLGGVASFLTLGTAALFVAYLLSPGYVVSGYLARGAPLLVFVVDVALAAGLYVLLQVAARAGAAALTAAQRAPGPVSREAFSAAVPGSLGVLVVGVFAVAVGSWLNVQRGYLALLPPTHFAFLKTLAEPPYVGQSFVGNRYMAPPAAYTGQWAYIDSTIGQARIELTDDGFRVAQELQTYVWLRDRATNPEYREPRYYLCTRFQSLPDALARAQGRENLEGSCNELPIVKRADSPGQQYLTYRVVGRDPSPFGSWAIVELDWDFPPYLRPLRGRRSRPDQPRVAVTVRESPAGPLLNVEYQYAHQKDRPEAATRLRLYRRDQAGKVCFLAEQAAPGPFAVPAGVTGTLLVTVQPATATKQGTEYLSDAVTVGSESAPVLCP